MKTILAVIFIFLISLMVVVAIFPSPFAIGMMILTSALTILYQTYYVLKDDEPYQPKINKRNFPYH